MGSLPRILFEAKAAALTKARDVVAALREMKPRETAKKIEDSVEETLIYMAFPFEHWTRICTNNAIERLNRETCPAPVWLGNFPDGNFRHYASMRQIAPCGGYVVGKQEAHKCEALRGRYGG